MTHSSKFVTVNGTPIEVPIGFCIDDLVAYMSVEGRYAVEIGGEIIPRSEHGDHLIGDGDTVEIVSAIGGG